MGQGYAIEMKKEAAILAQKNKEKFDLVNLEVWSGKAPDAG